jgi:hypothetical protein
VKNQEPLPLELQKSIDAGCFDNSIIGCSLLVRNHVGAVSFTVSKLDKIRIPPTSAEATALRWCFCLGKYQGYDN